MFPSLHPLYYTTHLSGGGSRAAQIPSESHAGLDLTSNEVTVNTGKETVMVELRLLTAFLAWAQMKQLGEEEKNTKFPLTFKSFYLE